MADRTDKDVVLRLDSVDKKYPGVHAINEVSIEVRRGEVHALVGQNGAGKSTLVGIAAGSVTADSGAVEIGGARATNPTPQWCREQGLAIVYQEPALLPDLTVAENMRLSMPEHLRPAVESQISWADEILEQWSNVASIDPTTPVRELQPDARFVAEIAKALAEEPKVVVLDEPTEHLLPAAVTELFRLIAELIDAGGAVVYISHRLNEVKQIAHTVSVLRDGALVGTFAGESVTEQDVVNLVVGRELTRTYTREAARTASLADTLLEVTDFSADRFSNVDFSVRAGEIVGFAGVEGQGQREVLRALGGLTSNRGTVSLADRAVKTSSPTAALDGGIAYLTHDRHNEGILPGLSLRENASLSAFDRVSRLGVIRRYRERKITSETFASMRVKAPSPEVDIATLSGGNQQKVVLSRVLMTESNLILADEPTQGVDIGAREEIYSILREASVRGAAIIVLSSSAAELEQLCDRVIVFSRGTIAKELSGEDLSEHGIAQAVLSATSTRSRVETTLKKVTLGRRIARNDLAPAAILAAATVLLAFVAISQSDFYFTSRNFGLVLPLLAILIFFAMAQQVVMMIGGIDLSVGPLAGLLVVVGSFVLSAYRSPVGMVLGLLVLVVVAAVVGLVNWTLAVVVKINPLIATLVTYTAIQGIAYLLRPLPEGTIDPVFLSHISNKIGFVPIMVIVAVAVAVILEYSLYRTLFGIRLRATGSDHNTADRVGVRTKLVALAAYIGCSVLVVPAALLLMTQAGTGNAGIGDSYTLASIGAAVLGGASIFGGRGSFIGACFGAVLVIQINTVVQFLDLPLYWQQWLLGGLTIAAAALYSRARTLTERK
ncbi:ATP-binding cassette domain-containing protein [Rhodococcus artemisiae]|uniref:ATP-binding cassette domain-containing protein n=1 Tax=Rhodococcus artemisiae TaxID=714159 RepID=A0ABU7LKW1_9NOCA|nr:ATP-binding cassette domain-containing protein [Rhodococcus artemisiae]MEE2062183.1 ATP-binding cassette domain-containing protein [Rhodococcus artemisiae]